MKPNRAAQRRPPLRFYVVDRNGRLSAAHGDTSGPEVLVFTSTTTAILASPARGRRLARSSSWYGDDGGVLDVEVADELAAPV